MNTTNNLINKILAIIVFAVTFSTYLYLASPSISFWDCGEYVATGASLGIPHPPGNPLYIMIARTATVLQPFIKDPAFRINVLTPLFGAITAMLIYLSIVRVFTGFLGTLDTTWKKFSVFIAGITGSFFAAFSNTMLFSAVEAEVNMPLLLPIILSTWLALVWAQSKNTKRDRLLLLIAYICFLGIGIHMYSMITLIPVFIFVLICDRSKRTDWRLWGTSLAMGLVMYDVSLFLYLCTAVILLTLIFSLFKSKAQSKWQFCFILALLAFLGFSVHLYIPIRSNLNPSIDENHPASFQAFKDYLDRKQYGSESMVTRMFWRRGALSNQYGVEGHMGFGGFLATQFFHLSPDDTSVKWFEKSNADGAKKLILYSLPVLFVLLGLYLLFRKSRNTAILLLLFLFLNTIAMVFYMNFSDGKRAERREYQRWEQSGKQGSMPLIQREVRVRDYFYITGFMYYGMAVGISSGLILLALYSNRRKIVSKTVAPFATILAAVSPALPMTQNIPLNNRHGDMIPYDYAYNLLMSCEKNGILFTNGDNDTFPLWALQEAFDFRKDIRIVNLSLLNTDWYIYQLKHFEPKVAITIPDDEIKKLEHMYNPFQQPSPYNLPNADIMVIIPPRNQLPLMQIQHQMVLHIVDANKWEKPIYFANTVPEDNFLGLDPHMSMQGFVYRIMQDTVATDNRFDVAKSEYLIDSVYKFRGLNTWRAQNDETTENLVSNNSAIFLKIALSMNEKIVARKTQINALQKHPPAMIDGISADTVIARLQRENDIDFNHALRRLNQCSELISWDWRSYMLRQELYTTNGMLDKAEQEVISATKKYPENVDLIRMKAQFLMDNKKFLEAIPTLKKLTIADEEPSFAYYALSRAYQEIQNFDSAGIALVELKKLHPNEPQVDQMIQQNESMKKH